MTEDPRLTCDDCDGLIQRSLVLFSDVPQVRLACACKTYERTQGRHVPFPNDIPDEWWAGEVKSPWH